MIKTVNPSYSAKSTANKKKKVTFASLLCVPSECLIAGLYLLLCGFHGPVEVGDII